MYHAAQKSKDLPEMDQGIIFLDSDNLNSMLLFAVAKKMLLFDFFLREIAGAMPFH